MEDILRTMIIDIDASSKSPAYEGIAVFVEELNNHFEKHPPTQDSVDNLNRFLEPIHFMIPVAFRDGPICNYLKKQLADTILKKLAVNGDKWSQIQIGDEDDIYILMGLHRNDVKITLRVHTMDTPSEDEEARYDPVEARYYAKLEFSPCLLSLISAEDSDTSSNDSDDEIGNDSDDEIGNDSDAKWYTHPEKIAGTVYRENSDDGTPNPKVARIE
jgi:hypothetical protein